MTVGIGTVVGSRYTLERTLGRGATATVWLARDATTGDDVAVKVLHDDLAESSARDRFTREAARTARLDHARILPVLDVGEIEGTIFFAQPFMPGGTLRERLRREGQLSLEETLRLGREIAEALAHAHSRGLVHRDVKPENILYRDGEPVLADFGICRALEASIEESSTSRLVVRGTAAYMSPEQAAGALEYDGRSDIFSLGAVLYECLAGVPAFVGATTDAVIAQVILTEPRDIRIYRATVPPSVAEILATCLAKRPADRFRDAEGLAAALSSPDRRTQTHVDPTRPAPEALATKARAGPSRRQTDRRRGMLIAGVLVAVTASTTLAVRVLDGPSVGVPALDSARVVLFPLERAPADTASDQFDDDRLRDGFQRADGISLVSRLMIADRLSQGEGSPRRGRLGAIARGLGAGRYVRGRIADRGGARWTSLSLFDAQGDSSLFDWEFPVPLREEEVTRAYARAATALLVRGTPSITAGADDGRRWSIAALRAYSQGQLALETWDLALADSLFEIAQSHSAGDPRIQFWLAQVRAWERARRTTWSALASRAAGTGDALPPREHRLALALSALGDRRFAVACAHYDTLRMRDPLDYAAWFGLGQCRYNDDVVVPDPHGSPSGWRFRSSHQQAFDAFERALTLLPSMHKGLQREGFDTKGIYFLRATDIRFARSEDGSRTFAGRPSFRGDTIAMIPYPMEVLATGASAIPVGFDDAIARQRASFARMAQAWSVSFPSGSEAKEAVALALELTASPAALDTIRVARALARSDASRMGLAAAEVRLLIRFGLPDDLLLLRRARLLADSLLAVAPVNHALVGEDLELMAVVRGRCDEAARFAMSMPGANNFGVPEGALVEARVLLDRVALRCDPVGDATVLRDFLARLEALPEARNTGSRAHLFRTLLMRPVLMMSRRDSLLVEALAAALDDPLVLAARDVARRDRTAARAELERFDRLAHPSLPMSPDYAFVAARLWADVGDTVRATALLDRLLRLVRVSDPQVLRESGSVSALMRTLSWRATLASAVGDSSTARRWRLAVNALITP